METSGLQDSSDTIPFDAASGISLEEQQEILAGINAMSIRSRLAPEAAITEAKKKGFLFPLFVNIGAFVLLVFGLALLSFFHFNDEQEIRESRAALGTTERMLVWEIRQETGRLIREKENQINEVLSKLADVDTEMVLQEEYRHILSGLEVERANILEDSRLKETAIRALAEEKAGGLSSQIEQNQANLSTALEELRRLGTEQERVNRAEAQMNGFYTTINRQISESLLAETSDTLRTMKEFLEAPSLRGIRSFEARKQIHLAAIAVMERAVSLSSGNVVPNVPQEEPPELLELRAQNAALEQKAATLERDIASAGAQGSEQVRAIAEYKSAISDLERNGTVLQQAINRRDGEIQTLRTEMARRVSELNGNIASLQAQNEDIQRQNNDLQRQNNDIQRRAEAAIRAFTEE